MAGIGWVAGLFPPDVVVEDAPVDGPVDVGQAEIHVVAFNGAGYTADEDHCAIGILPFDNPYVRQRIIYLAVTVVVPCVVEEDEVAWVSDRPLVKRALLLYVRIDEADAICFRIAFVAAVQIDTVSEKHRTSHPCAIVSNAPTVALDHFGADEFGRGLDDRIPVRRRLDGSTTGACSRCRCARTFDWLRGTTYERHDGDSGCDEEKSHCLSEH